MWLYKVALFSLIVRKLSYTQTLDKKDWLCRQKSASGVKNIQLTLSWKYLKSFHFPFISSWVSWDEWRLLQIYLHQVSRISNRKTKCWYFDCPQIIKSIWDQSFQIFMYKKEPCACGHFWKLLKIFGKYKQVVANLLSSLQDIGANISIKLDFMCDHLDLCFLTFFGFVHSCYPLLHSHAPHCECMAIKSI